MTDKIFDDLAQLYRNLDESLPRYSGNACGDCRECCTAEGLSRHHVSELELAHIARRVGPERAGEFKQYVEHQRTAAGAFMHEGCPFYDTARKGCGIYEVRPFSCRIFGHYRADNSHFPPPCVFKGRERVFEPSTYIDTVPYARQLRELMRMHMAIRDDQPVRYVSPANLVDREPTEAELALLSDRDPYDRAMLHQVKGEYAEALQALGEAWKQEGDVPYLLSAIGLLFELIGNHGEAVAAFTRAVAKVPDCASFHYHIGYNALSAGDQPLALEHLLKTVELNPQHALAMGFLGYLHIIAGQTEAGAGYLERASTLDPDNGFFHLRLGLAYMSMGRLDEAVPRLQQASTFAPTREQALQILQHTAFAP